MDKDRAHDNRGTQRHARRDTHSLSCELRDEGWLVQVEGLLLREVDVAADSVGPQQVLQLPSRKHTLRAEAEGTLQRALLLLLRAGQYCAVHQ